MLDYYTVHYKLKFGVLEVCPAYQHNIMGFSLNSLKLSDSMPMDS